MFSNQIPLRIIGFIFLILTFISCSSADQYDLKTASGHFKYAQKLESYKDYEMAIIHYKSVKNKFPYNPLAIEAELKIADLLYEQNKFIESEGAYKVFKEFHPKHKKKDYVIYKLGMSLFKQASKSIDRDLSPLQKALPIFDEFMRLFDKSSPYYEKTLKQRTLCMQKLAEKELYIAKFYLKQRFYVSALRRYEKLIEKYPENGKNSVTLYGAMISAHSTKKKEKFKKYYSDLIKEYPQSKEAKKAKKKFPALKK